MMNPDNMKEARMKRPVRWSVLAGALVVLTVLLLAETVVVKIQSTNLRKEPKFYSQTIATLTAGNSLEKLSSQDGWFQVRTSAGVVGWIHSSAVETKKFNLLAVDKSMKTQASAGEVALAAKGFNKQVEESYKAKHGEANFAAVDRMLQLKISPSDVEAFLRKGKLGEFGDDK
jgi:SH3-like domain-containing protein